MRFRPRTLLIVLAIGPPLIAAIWPAVSVTRWPPKPFIPIPDGVMVPESSPFYMGSRIKPYEPPMPSLLTKD
jgi:hypothetical protein